MQIGIIYFPCNDLKVAELYVDAVTGFLTGKYRILETYRCKILVKAELQKPQGNEWQTIGKNLRLWLPIGKKSYRTIRNNNSQQ